MSNEVEEHVHEVHRRDAARVVRVLLIAALVAAVVAVALDNRRDARLGYVVGDASAPTWAVIVIAAVVGAVVGWLVRHRPRRHS